MQSFSASRPLIKSIIPLIHILVERCGGQIYVIVEGARGTPKFQQKGELDFVQTLLTRRLLFHTPLILENKLRRLAKPSTRLV